MIQTRVKLLRDQEGGSTLIPSQLISFVIIQKILVYEPGIQVFGVSRFVFLCHLKSQSFC